MRAGCRAWPRSLEALDRCDDPGGPGRRWWTLDPVDGTKGFLRNEQYAVALALVEDGEVVLAAMGCPTCRSRGRAGRAGSRGCLFVAERGAGRGPVRARRARRRRRAPPGHADRRGDPDHRRRGRALRRVGRGRAFLQSAAALIAARLGITAEPLRLDSQTKYAVVARGDASIYLRLAARRLPRERLGPCRRLAHRERGGWARQRRGWAARWTSRAAGVSTPTAGSWPQRRRSTSRSSTRWLPSSSEGAGSGARHRRAGRIGLPNRIRSRSPWRERRSVSPRTARSASRANAGGE